MNESIKYLKEELITPWKTLSRIYPYFLFYLFPLKKKLSLGNEESLTTLELESDVVRFVSQKAPRTAVWEVDRTGRMCSSVHTNLHYWSGK